MGILSNNLAKIDVDYDLFGNKIEKLSMKDRIGFLPISIWEPNWAKTKALKEIIGDSGQTRKDAFKKVNHDSTKDCYKISTSIFNPHLAQMILSAYCPQNAKIYDPFAGGGTRAFIASAMGHKYYGIELRQEEVDRIIEKRKELDKVFHIHTGDSQVYPFEKNIFDFSYTCPPYYNLEKYSDLAGDISNANTYDDFLNMLKHSIAGVYSSLKSGCLSVWVVGNFRNKNGSLIHFSGDVIRIGREVGFDLHDELIFWGASKSAAQRCGLFAVNRKSVRVHEYIIVFKKP